MEERSCVVAAGSCRRAGIQVVEGDCIQDRYAIDFPHANPQWKIQHISSSSELDEVVRNLLHTLPKNVL